MRRRLLLLTTAALAVTGAAGAEAHQTGGHGANGRIIITSERPGSLDGQDIWSVNPDGSGAINLTNRVGWDGNPVVSPDGSKILFTSLRKDSQDYDVFVMDADGRNQVNLTNSPGQDSQPVWSPDGSRIAFTAMGQNLDVFVMNADGSGRVNITNDPAYDQGPAWSPDGSRIAFSSGRSGDGVDVFTMAPDGSQVTNLTKRPGTDEAPVWSPGGDAIAYHSDAGGEGYSGIWLMRADGSGRAWVTRSSERGSHRMPVFSPDGRQIAFESNRLSAAGSSDVFVINTDGTGERNITHDGSPYLVPEGGGVPSNSDSPGSWATDRSVPAPAQAPVAFPPAAGDIRETSEVDAFVTPQAGRRVKVLVDVMRKGMRTTWPSECHGDVVLRFTAGKRTLLRKTLPIARTADFCRVTRTIKIPKGPRTLKLSLSFKGNEMLQPARASETVKLK